MKRGLYIGRFQPFHNGHLQGIKDALEEVDELAIGIGSSQESDTKENPFTVMERMEMVSLVLKEEDIENYVLFSVPDFHDDEKWVSYIEAETTPFQIVFTGNEWTERCFSKKGYKVKKVRMIEGLNSTDIRKKIRDKGEWKHLVPKEITDYIEYVGGVEKIQKLA